MLFVALILAAVALLFLEERYYSRHAWKDLDYSARLSAEEVFEEEDVYLYEVLSNQKSLPLPNLRAESELPEGLQFRLHGTEAERGKDRFSGSVRSVFVLHGNEQIRRRWRVTCRKRGVYRVGSVLLIAGDLLGLSQASKRITEPDEGWGCLTVLPRPIDLEEIFVPSAYLTGDAAAPRALLTDPMLLSGTREYTPLDPWNKINWKSTAVHDRLMVNIEDYTRRQRFLLLLNMQSRPIELHPSEPSDPAAIELGISVCATLLDRLSASETPVRMLINTDPDALASGRDAVSEPEIEGGGKAVLTREYRGRQDVLEALRLLAALPLQIGAPAEALWDHFASNAAWLADGGNVVIVSAYLDERMLILHDLLSRMGCHAVFYITGTTQNTVIPEDVDVYFRAWKGGGSRDVCG